MTYFHLLLQINIGKNIVNLGLIVVDMQNGFVSKGGSYDKLDMSIENYRKIIPKIQELISFCREEDIPIFYTEAIREPSGIDLLLIYITSYLNQGKNGYKTKRCLYV